MKRKLTPSDELRDFALAGAREKMQTIFRLFPELLDEFTSAAPAPSVEAEDAPLTPKQKRLKQHALANWHGTNGSSGSLKGLSMGPALRKVLDAVPRTNHELQALLLHHGYKHAGRTGLSSRVSQEMRELVQKGFAKKQAATKGKSKQNEKLAWSVNQGGQ